MQSDKHKTTDLIGLVACGGKSERMGRDKSLLDYNGMKQRYHCFELISTFCEKVFLSLNRNQLETGNYPVLADDEKFIDIGPMAALLTAHQFLPGKSFLLIGCDYPLLSAGDIRDFLEQFSTVGHSAAFYNTAAGLYEPLLALYHLSDLDKLVEQFNEKNYSLQYFLKMVNAEKFYPANINVIKSVDDITSCTTIKNMIQPNVITKLTGI